MAKFYGAIGYAVTEETKPGVWVEQIKERQYFGEVTRLSRSLQTSGNVNDNVVINHNISIIADPFAYQNFHAIRYVEYLGAKWKVTSVEVNYPRLTLSVGGVYNVE